MTDFSNPLQGSQLFAITPSPSQQIQGPTQANGKPLGYCLGFISDTAGSISAISRQGPATPVTIPVLAGVAYPFGLRQVLSTTPAMNLLGWVN